MQQSPLYLLAHVATHAKMVNCATQQNIDYHLSAVPIMPLSSTATTSLSSASNQSLLSACTPAVWLKIGFKIDAQADIDPANSIANGQQSYFKIRSLLSATAGGIATEYLLQHAFISFALLQPAIGQWTQITAVAGSIEGIVSTTQWYAKHISDWTRCGAG